jgi:TPR repeat protein
MKRKTGNAAIAVCGALMLVACSRSPEARCKKGDGPACAVAGDQVRKRGGKGANDTACEFYRRACGFGYSTGCANLGAMLARRECEGEGGEALRVLERACDSDDVTGCNNLGMLFGELRACANLGSRYLLGDGVPVDALKGRELLAKACTGGVEEACTLPPAAP